MNPLQRSTPGGQDAGSGSRCRVPDSVLYLTDTGGLAFVAQWCGGPPCSFPWRWPRTCSAGPEFAVCGRVQNEPTSRFWPWDGGPGGAAPVSRRARLPGKPLAPLQSGKSLAAAKQTTQLSLGEQSNPFPTPKLSHIGTDSPSIPLAVYDNLPRPTATADSVASP